MVPAARGQRLFGQRRGGSAPADGLQCVAQIGPRHVFHAQAQHRLDGGGGVGDAIVQVRRQGGGARHATQDVGEQQLFVDGLRGLRRSARLQLDHFLEIRHVVALQSARDLMMGEQPAGDVLVVGHHEPADARVFHGLHRRVQRLARPDGDHRRVHGLVQGQLLGGHLVVGQASRCRARSTRRRHGPGHRPPARSSGAARPSAAARRPPRRPAAACRTRCSSRCPRP